MKRCQKTEELVGADGPTQMELTVVDPPNGTARYERQKHDD